MGVKGTEGVKGATFFVTPGKGPTKKCIGDGKQEGEIWVHDNTKELKPFPTELLSARECRLPGLNAV